jgi:succinoglycan biosynthesis transport protein ExoP
MNQRNLPLNGRLAIPAPSNGEPDGFIDLERLFQMAVRRARVVAICAILGLALGIVYLMFAVPNYTAATRILIDESLTKFAQEEAPAASNMKSDANLLTEVEILKSTRLALVVVDREKLDENEAFMNPPQSPIGWFKSRIKAVVGLFDLWGPEVSEAAIKNSRRQRAAALLQQALYVERVGRSFVIDVSYASHIPQLAGSITRAYANAYLSDQLDANFDATQRATVWLQGRLTDLKESSQSAALEVEQFRAANGLTAARGELMSERQLADLNSQLILAQAETASASARFTQYKSIVDSGPLNAVKNATISSKEVGANSVIDALKTRYLSVSKREQEITNRFGEDHPQAVSLRREQEDVARQIFQELTQLTESYRNEFEVARSREASLRENIKKVAGQSSESSQALVQLRDLEQKAAALKTLYETYLARYEEASQQRSFPIAKARVISEAGVPVSPSSPKKSMVLALSIVLGLMAGAGMGAIQEFRERFFRLGDEVRSELGLKFLGYLPIIGGSALEKARSQKREAGRANADPRDAEPAFKSIMRVAIDAPGSAFAETLRNARVASDVVLQGKSSKVIGVVSALPHEGKSTVAANFAGLLAANGSRTLLIDGDLRNPGLSRMLSNTPEHGLVAAIMGEIPWPSAVKVDRKTRLAILPAPVRGRISHTSELISSQGMRKIIESAREKFDYIVVDLPPLVPVVDAKAFAHMADGFVFVTAWGATPRALVRSLLQAEPQIAAKVLGLVLNKTDMKLLGRYGSFGSSEQYIEKYAGYYVDQSAIGTKT